MVKKCFPSQVGAKYLWYDAIIHNSEVMQLILHVDGDQVLRIQWLKDIHKKLVFF